MKKLLSISGLVFFLATIVMASHDPTPKKMTYTINGEKSTVTWTGKKVTGSHTGTLGIKTGTITANEKEVLSTSIVMDMTKIICTDIENMDYNKKLIGHLMSEDFFAVESHPLATFEATNLNWSDKDKNYIVTGTLTIKGISHEIFFPVQVERNGGMITAEGTASFDRTKWNIKYGSGQFFESLGDKMIYDNIEMTFNLVATLSEEG